MTRMVIARRPHDMRLALLLMSFAVAAAGCTDDDGLLDTDDVEVSEDDKADAATELRVRVSETTLWIDRALARRGDDFVLRGRTSRNITDGRAFIFDDIYGDFVQTSARTFEVSWPVSTARGVVDGVNLFTGLTLVNRPAGLTSRVVVRPRLSAITGSSYLTLTAEITPIVYAGRIVYRVKGRSTKPLTAVTSTAGTARLVDATHFELDLDFDQVTATASLGFEAQTATGPLTIRGMLGLAVKYLGFTAGDVETVFPSPACTADRESCLAALPDGALDLAACGPALLVQACRNELGVVIDQAAINATLAAADARLADPMGFAKDATALVGTDRAAGLRVKLRERIAASAGDKLGLWLLTDAAKQAVLGVEPAFDAAYVNPLAFVPAAPLAPGDVAKTRHVVADALLRYLLTTDYANSEFGRSYAELTRMFRTQHVASLRVFRETVMPESFASLPNTDYYIDRWLGTHTEIGVTRTTGAVSSVLVELD